MKPHSPLKHVFFSLFLFTTTVFAQDDCPDCREPSCDGQLTAGGDWLYWKVTQDGLDAGSFVDDFPGPLKIVNAQPIFPNFTYNSGFRVNLDYKVPCDRCELSATYTYIPLHANAAFRETIPLDEQSPTHGQLIFPNLTDFSILQAFSGNTGQVAFTSLLNKWGGNLSYLDIDVARKLTFSYSFHLRPHIGFRAAWMGQHLLLEGSLAQPSVNNTTFAGIHFQEQYNGYGIEAGIWGDWQLGWGLGLLGHFGGSILYSRIKEVLTSNGSLGEEGPVVFIINTNAGSITAIPTLEFFGGLVYEKSVGHFCIALRAGWEQRVFFDMNRFALTGGNLSLQGITLGGNIGYQF